MDLAKVIGTVVATQRDPAFEQYRFAVVQPVDAQLRPAGQAVVAIDALNRTRGDLVYLVRSGDAMFAHFGEKNLPTDCAIGGLVDGHHVAGEPER